MRALASAASVPAWPPPTTITSNFSGKCMLFVTPYSGRNDTRLQVENEMGFDARENVSRETCAGQEPWEVNEKQPPRYPDVSRETSVG